MVRLLPSHYRLSFESFRLPLAAEAGRSPWVRTQNFAPSLLPLPQSVFDGFRALLLQASLPTLHGLTALRFRSVRCCTLGFHQTHPRGPPSPPSFQAESRRRALGCLRRFQLRARLERSLEHDWPSNCALATSVRGFPPPGPSEDWSHLHDFTSCFAPMPGAPAKLAGA